MDEALLRNQYSTLQKSGQQIAREYGCSKDKVYFWIKKFSILLRSRSETGHLVRANHVLLSETAIEFLNGTLLGDCHLESRKWSANIQQSSKYEDYLKWFSGKLTQFGIGQVGNIHKSKGTEYFRDRKTGKWYTCKCYFYSSKSYVELKDWQKKWYRPATKRERAEGRKFFKVVPLNLKLTPLTCRQWYIDDGFLNRQWRSIVLYTQGFEEVEVKYLVNMLCDLGFKAKRRDDNTIFISARSTKAFLEYIGPYPVECYKYKWEV